MNDTRKQSKSETYQRIRSDFDALSSQDKVVFLAEAASSTVIQGAQQFGEALSHEIDDFLGKRDAEFSGGASSEADAEDISVTDAAGAVVRSLQRFGHVLSNEFEDMFRRRSGKDDAAREEASEPAAEETAEETADDAAKSDDAS